MDESTKMAAEIAELKAQIAALSAAKRTKKSGELRSCWCGCGGTTKSRFMPGHDARFYGEAKRVARGQLSVEDLPAKPHAEAQALFDECVAEELAIVRARLEATKTERMKATETEETEETEETVGDEVSVG